MGLKRNAGGNIPPVKESVEADHFNHPIFVDSASIESRARRPHFRTENRPTHATEACAPPSSVQGYPAGGGGEYHAKLTMD